MNRANELWSLNYGKVCVSQFDAIEKKPIFHFQPGSRIYSVGSMGCNLACDYCQNMMLSHPLDNVPSRYVPARELVQEALERNAEGIAFTFNEPIVWAEYLLDVSQEAHSKGLFLVMNTNGYMESEAAKELVAAVDVVKIDIKGFDEDVYRRTCGGELQEVLESCRTVRSLHKHLELSYLMIPGITDDVSMLDRLSDWISSDLDRDVPVHLFRFQPAGRMSHLEAEPLDKMDRARERLLLVGPRYVYLGGEAGTEGRDTLCPKCGEKVIIRALEEIEPGFILKDRVSRFCPSFSKVEDRSHGGLCPNCRSKIPIYYWHERS